jgi:tol-pal system protein YbgF
MKRLMTLSLLVSAASVTFAAPAPVSDLNSTTQSASASSSSESSVQRLERLLQNSNRLQVNLQQQVDDMSLEISELRGALEQSQYDSNQMVLRQKELFIELDKMRTELAELKQNGVAAAVPVDVQEQPQTAGTYTDNEAEKAAYQTAVDLVIKQRDYDAALTAFETFNKDYPQSVYSANSNYWLGQLYFTKKEDIDSAKAFAIVVSNQDSNKRADALVKLGEIAARNGNATAAKQYYQQVLDEYQGSASATKAGERMQALN